MKKTFTYIFLCFISIIAANNTYAQNYSTEGTDFWVGFMKNIEETNTTELSVYISAKTNSTGTVSIPLIGWSQNFSVSANTTTQVIVPLVSGMCLGSGNIESKGVHVTSNNPVSVFALNYESATSDATLVYPTKQLRNEYFALSFETTIGGSPSEFVIVSIKDNTQIQIIPADNTVDGHNAGVAYNVTLDQGETYQVQSNGDLSGSHVSTTSNDECDGFAFFSGVVCTNVPNGCYACDHLYEQVPPVSAWGTKFISDPLKTRNGDLFRILASQNGTSVTINDGTIQTVNLNAGQFYETTLSAAAYITSNKPILVAQYSRGSSCDNTNSDPFMIYLSSVEQFLQSITFNAFTSSIITNYYLNVITQTSDVSSITLDGASISGSFSALGANPAYSIAQIDITQGNHTISSTGAGVAAYVYGYGSYESYGYSAGTSLSPLNISTADGFETTGAACGGGGQTGFTVTRKDNIASAFSISGSYISGTATNGVDYTIQDVSTINFAANQESVFIPVNIIDDNVCEGLESIILNLPPVSQCSDSPPLNITLYIMEEVKATLNVQCQGNNLSVTANTTCGSLPFTYSVDNGNYQNSSAFTTSQGSHIMHIKDKFGCIFDFPFSASSGAPLDIPDKDLCGISLPYTIDAGSGYTAYLWNTGATTQTLTVNAEGFYSVTVTNSTGCTNNDQVTIAVLTSPNTSISGDLDICSSESTVLDGGGGFDSYLWNNNMTTQTISATQAGTYTVTVTDFAGCTATATVSVSTLAAPAVSISSPPSICGSGSATITATPGMAQYVWSNGQDGTPQITVNAGTYSVTVTDFTGCTNTASVSLATNSKPTPTISGTLEVCNNAATTLSAPTGFTYLWSTGVSTQNINATPGSYFLTVTDGNGCTGTTSALVKNNPKPNPTITGTLTVCAGSSTTLSTQSYNGYLWSNGGTTQSISATQGSYGLTVTDSKGCTGTASATVIDAPLPTPSLSGDTELCTGETSIISLDQIYSSYTWNNGATTQTLNGVAAGSYNVTVTNSNGCSGTASIQINLTANPTPTISGLDNICSNGNATTPLDAGSGYASYVWSTTETTQIIDVQGNDAYAVTVTNAGGCTGTASFFVQQNPPPVPSITGTMQVCGNNTTTLSTGNFASFIWSTGATTQSVSNVGGGNYSVTVTDAAGCTGSATGVVAVINATPPNITGQNAMCGSLGTTTLTASSGYTQYLWNTNATTQTLSASPGNAYTLTVTDAGGCTATATFSVVQNPLPTPSITGNPTVCGNQTSTIALSTTFAQYAWNTGSTTQSITAGVGSYSVTVTDINGCTGTTAYAITQAPNPNVSITGNTTICQAGNATLNAGTGFSSYIWNTSATTASINTNTAGTYSVTVSNADGCTASAQTVVSIQNNLSPTITGPTAACGANPNGTLDAGVGYASYIWSTTATTQTISVSSAGSYSVTVTDAGGCTGSAAYQYTINPNPSASISGPSSTCAGFDVTFTASAGFASYVWNTNATTNSIAINTAGSYSVTVSDSNGCTASAEKTLSINSSLSVSIAGNSPICEGTNTTFDAGAGFSVYTWNTGATTQTISISTAGSYSVTVSDSNGCTGSAEKELTITPLPIPTIEGLLTFCPSGSTDLSTQNFASYAWSTGATTSGIVVSVPDLYSVTVSDVSGCTGSASVTVVQLNQLLPTISGEPSICDGGNATISVNEPFSTYLWNTTETTQSISSSTAGNYSVTVSDASGCTGSSSFELSINPNPIPVIMGNTLICSGESTSLNAGVFESYLWNTGEQTQTITPSTEGTYVVTVTNAQGCTGSSDIAVIVSVINPPLIDANTNICEGTETPFSVFPAYDGYLWNTGATAQTIAVSQNGLYSVTVSNADGCTSTAELFLNTVPKPTPQISGSTTLCEGGSTLLDAGNYDFYEWSTGSTTASIEVTQTGNYKVTVTNATGCSGSAAVQVTVSSNLNPNIVGDLDICIGETTTLNAGAGFSTYLWNTGATTQTINTGNAGSYSVTVSNGNCSGSATAVVVVNNLPTPVISGNAPICEGQSLSLSIQTGFDKYEWNTGGLSNTLLVTQSGTYSATVTNANGCTNSTSVSVTVNPLPTTSITGTPAVCEGATSSLNAGNFAGYSWNTGATTQTLSVAQTGTYTVTVSSAAGCTATANFVFTANPNPVPQISGSTAFCAGGSSVLSAGNFANYVWNTGATTASINVAQGGNYSVTVSSSAGCTGTAAVTVTQSNNLEPVIVGNLNLCATENTTLDAGAGFESYAWSTGATTQTINTSNAGNYSVTVANGNCTGSASATVLVNPNPIVQISGVAAVCAGSSSTLSVPVFDIYQWNTGANTQSIEVNQTGTYSITVTNSNGCTATADFIFTVNPLPQPTIVGQNTACEGETISISTQVFESYSWSSNATTQSINITQSGNYSVTVTNSGGCTGTAIFGVTISPNPTVQISGSTTFCAGGNTTLSGTAGFNAYAWSNGSTEQSINVNTPNTYSVTVSNASGCTATAGVTVIESTQLEPLITGNMNLCAGETTTLDAGIGFETYTWSNGADSPTITVSQSGVYSVTVTNGSCSGSASATVTVNPLPVPFITGTPSICEGQTATLDAGTGFDEYEWSTGATTQSIDIQQSGTYTLTVTNANSCTSTGSFNLSVQPLPTLTLIGDTAICIGASTTLSTSSSFDTYLWNTGATTQSINTNTAGTYSITVTNANGCSASGNRNVVVLQNLQPVISGNTAFCAGNTVTISVEPYSTYLWSNGATTQSITVSTAGDYSVTVSNQSGCTGSTAVIITQNVGLEPVISGSTTFCAGGSSTLSTQVFDEYVWNTGATTQSITVNSTGAYTVTVSSADGCTGTAAINVSESTELSPNIVGDLDICAGESTTLDAGAGFESYNWNTGATTQTINTSNAETYSVTVTSGTCSGSATASVTLNPNPTVNLLNISTCEGNAASIDAGTGFASYTWNTGATTQTIDIQQNGTYTVTVSNAAGCTATATATAVFTTPLSIEHSFSCAGTTGYIVSITIAGGISPYTVNGTVITGSTFSSALQNSGTGYSFVIDDQSNCTAVTADHPEAIDCGCLPPANPIVSNVSYCQGKPIPALTVQNIDNTNTYHWYDAAQNGNLLSTGTTYTPTQAGTYWVVATNTGGCMSAAIAVLITLNPLPDASFGYTASSYCVTEAITLPINLATPNGVFSATPAGLSINANTGAIDPALSQVGNYTITYSVTNADGCSNSNTTTVAISSSQIGVTAGNDQTVCEGTPVVLQATLTGTGSFSWISLNGVGTFSDTQSANSTFNAPAGTYTLVATLENTCSSTIATDTLTVTILPSVHISLSANTSIEKGQIIQLAATGSTNYVWTPSVGLSCFNCPDPLASPKVTTTYTVITNAQCADTAQVTIEVLPVPVVIIPNAFSPNGDGENDVFRIRGARVKQYELAVFSRWGERMYYANIADINQGWDGTFKGKNCELDTYVYYAIVSFENGDKETFKGNVTLIR